jgi:phosphate butyryltransferase
MILKSLDALVAIASQKGRKRTVIAVAQDEDVLKAAKMAMDYKLITPILIGDKESIQKAAIEAGLDVKGWEVLHVKDKVEACARAVQYIKEGKGDILMKGMVSTSILLKAILDKEKGLVGGGLLSHLAFFESPYYSKIMCITDAALNIAPDFNEKVAIVNNAVLTYHKLGFHKPLVAVLAAVETVNPRMEATVHASMLTQMQRRNQIEGCIIDGPLALDNAISAVAAKHKDIHSEVAGNADILVAPDLNAGNILYKSLNFLGGAVCAAIVSGAAAPVVLTSRADQDKSKFLSIALAVAIT